MMYQRFVRSSIVQITSRRKKLASLLKREGYSSVADLSRRLLVSEATIRRDLTALEGENQITRTHGGALSEYDTLFVPFFERRSRNPILKRRIAREALHQLCPGHTVFLDAGSTVFSLAREISRSSVMDLTVVTNSLPIAEALTSNGGTEVHLLGGQLLPHQLVLVGLGTSLSLSAWKFDRAFLGAQAVSKEGLWNSQDEICDFQRHVCGRSRRSYFCVDESKLGQSAPSFLMSWREVDQLISTATEESFSERGIHLGSGQLLHAGPETTEDI